MGTTQVQLVALEPSDEVLEASPGAPLPLPALELPSARKPGWPTLAALAVACGVVAAALGAWALVTEIRSDPQPTRSTADTRSLAVLADASAERYPLRGSVGRMTLVVGDDDSAVLALDGLGAAPHGAAYAIWVVSPGSAVPRAAGTFDAIERVVAVGRPVPAGARVAVTLEPEPGAARPSRPLRLVAVRVGR